VIGRLTERVTVQARSIVNNGGTPVPSYADVTGLVRVPASVQTTAGQRVERVFGAQVQSETTHTVSFAMPATDIALTSQIVWHSRHGDRTLQIVGKAVQQDARMRTVTLACQEPRTP
jgi:head-tail adaptor